MALIILRALSVCHLAFSTIRFTPQCTYTVEKSSVNIMTSSVFLLQYSESVHTRVLIRLFINSLAILPPNPTSTPAHLIKINICVLSQNKAHLRSLITSGEATTTAKPKPVICLDFPPVPYTWELHTAILNP